MAVLLDVATLDDFRNAVFSPPARVDHTNRKRDVESACRVARNGGRFSGVARTDCSALRSASSQTLSFGFLAFPVAIVVGFVSVRGLSAELSSCNLIRAR